MSNEAATLFEGFKSAAECKLEDLILAFARPEFKVEPDLAERLF